MPGDGQSKINKRKFYFRQQALSLFVIKSAQQLKLKNERDIWK